MGLGCVWAPPKTWDVPPQIWMNDKPAEEQGSVWWLPPTAGRADTDVHHPYVQVRQSDTEATTLAPTRRTGDFFGLCFCMHISLERVSGNIVPSDEACIPANNRRGCTFVHGGACSVRWQQWEGLAHGNVVALRSAPEQTALVPGCSRQAGQRWRQGCRCAVAARGRGPAAGHGGFEASEGARAAHRPETGLICGACAGLEGPACCAVAPQGQAAPARPLRMWAVYPWRWPCCPVVHGNKTGVAAAVAA